VKIIPWETVRGRLGRVPDIEIAGQLGVSRSLVCEYRLGEGISAYQLKVDWNEEPRLGKVIDRELAEWHGVQVNDVYKARKRRGIPACRNRAIS